MCQNFQNGCKTSLEAVVSFVSFVSCRPEVFLQIGVPAKLPKSLKNTCEGVHFLVKLSAES